MLMIQQNGIKQMRSKFGITSSGKIVHPDDTSPSDYAIMVERRGHAIKINIQPDCQVWPLIILLRTIRQARAKIHFTPPLIVEHARYLLDVPEACLLLGRFILEKHEQQQTGCYGSTFGLWDDYIGLFSDLPLPVITIGQARLTHLETAAALTHFTEDQLRPAAFYYPDSEQNLHISKIPKGLCWPETIDMSGDGNLLTSMEEADAHWLLIAAETALAIRKPLLQQGWYLGPEPTDDSDEDKADTATDQKQLMQNKFIRLLYPLSAQHERPANYRLLTVAYRLNGKNIML